MDFRQLARDASLWSVGSTGLGLGELIVDGEPCADEEQDQSSFSEGEELPQALS